MQSEHLLNGGLARHQTQELFNISGVSALLIPTAIYIKSAKYDVMWRHYIETYTAITFIIPFIALLLSCFQIKTCSGDTTALN